MAEPKWVTDGYDLHLVGPVPGSNASRTYALGNLFFPNGIDPWSTNALGFTFDPVFPFTTTRHGLHVEVNGVVTFSSAVPSDGDVIRNFIVNAVSPQEELIPIRIHRHDELVDAVVTPPQLTIHENASMQFSILATFKDKSHSAQLVTVGDISRQPGLSWGLQPGTPGAALLVTSTGPMLALQAGSTVGVQVLLPDSLYQPGIPPATKTATVKTIEGWDADQPDSAALLPLGKKTSVDRIADSWNVLFLPDGIQDRSAFSRIVAGIVDSMSLYRESQPYKKLIENERFNFWWGWLDSPDAGGMELNELGLGDVSDFRRTDVGAGPVVPPRVLEAGNPITDVAQLTYRVGLPTQDALAITDFAVQRDAWIALFDAAHVAGVTLKMWVLWRDEARRYLLREKDTSLGVAIGVRPQVSGRGTESITWHPFRTQRADLDKFLKKVFTKAASGTRIPMGDVWTTGKDRKLVVVVSNAPRARGTNNISDDRALAAFTLSGQEYAELVAPPNTSAIVDAKTPDLPVVLRARRIGTFIHELTHSFHVGDEYSQDGKDIPTATAEKLREDKPFWNLLVDADVRDGAGHIRAARIRWARWPRIVAAAIVRVATVTPTSVTLDVRTGQGQLFKKAIADGKLAVGGILYLRRRPLVQIDPGSATDDDRDVLGPAMTLQSVTDDRIVATSQGNVATWVTDAQALFANGNVIVIASRKINGVEQFLLDPTIGALIEALGPPTAPKGGGLNWKPNQTTCALDERDVQSLDAISAFTATSVTKDHATIVGLFDGGDSYSCGVFHASGSCAMRKVPIDLDDAPPAVRRIAKTGSMELIRSLCHVCRYILTDQIDPTLHGFIDDLYPPPLIL